MQNLRGRSIDDSPIQRNFIQKNIEAIQIYKKRSITPPPIKIVQPRKTLPSPISERSHLLAPTIASLMKKREGQKSELTKSRSSNNLLTYKPDPAVFNRNDAGKNQRVTFDSPQLYGDFLNEDPSPEPSLVPIRIKKRPTSQDFMKPIENGSPNLSLIFLPSDDSPIDNKSDSSQVLMKKLSNPKNLEIDTEKIENEYATPKEYEPLPIEYVKLDTLNFYSSHFSIREAIVSDILTGKIFISKKILEGGSLLRKCKGIRKKNIEKLVYEVEFKPETSDCTQWLDIKTKLISKFKGEVFDILEKLSKSNKFAPKIIPLERRSPNRALRKLDDLSAKIGMVIESKLKANKKEDWLKQVISNDPTIPDITLELPQEYTNSDEMIVDLFLILWKHQIKPLSPKRLALYLEPDRLILKLPKIQDPPTKIKSILQLIPLLILNLKLKEANHYIKSVDTSSKPAKIWEAWISILYHVYNNGSTKEAYYMLQSVSPSTNYTLLYKIACIYTFYFSCIFRGIPRSVSYAKSLDLGEWEGIVIADLMLRSEAKDQEEKAVEILRGMIENTPHLRFLAAFRLFQYYKDYSLLPQALEIANQNLSFFNDQFKDWNSLFQSCVFKILARNRTEITYKPTDPYLQYQISRLSLKYNLNTDIVDIITYLNTVIKYGSIYNLANQLFTFTFWKFIYFRREGFHRIAAKLGATALDYEPLDNDKILSIKKYLAKYNKVAEKLKQLGKAKSQNDTKLCKEIQENLEDFDKNMGLCISLLLELNTTLSPPKNISLCKSLLKVPHKFENMFVNWYNLYKSKKIKEKQFKCLDGQEEIDKRDKNNPLYVLKKIKSMLESFELAESNCLSLKPEVLWILVGKGFGGIEIIDSLRVMQGKTYLRINVSRSVQKLKKGTHRSKPHPILYYYLAKFQIALIKQTRHASEAQFNQINLYLNSFVSTEKMNPIYQLKVLYLNAELAFMCRNYEQSLRYFQESEKYANSISSNYLKIPKRLLNADIITQRLPKYE
ncbi:unnamed protein product [Blepharisma stoltei]|uniref:Uncharacterized protein n=1 Tax=Blepharisma stoltei TaxID=1481888 RepID=A0AAU9JTD9_9CILI|nr:unnamed protein product [Blepharisma stoltei]